MRTLRNKLAEAWGVAPRSRGIGLVDPEPLPVDAEPLSLGDRIAIAQRRAEAYERRAHGDEEGLDALIAETYRGIESRLRKEAKESEISFKSEPLTADSRGEE